MHKTIGAALVERLGLDLDSPKLVEEEAKSNGGSEIDWESGANGRLSPLELQLRAGLERKIRAPG